ncbi:MAG: hypothetical protein Fur0041_05010 [Bacteroidia bacterium]
MLTLLPEMKAQQELHFRAGFSPSLEYSDTTKKPAVHSPKKAVIMSACLPGLGQVYNKKWWKVPIIYAGFGALGYGFYFNHREFKIYRDALRLRYDDDPLTTDQFAQYSDDNLVTLKNYYQRFRDLSVIGMAALYTLNIVDAAVDAHLLTFDISDDLSLHVAPALFGSGQQTCSGFSARIQYR